MKKSVTAAFVEKIVLFLLSFARSSMVMIASLNIVDRRSR